MHAPKRMGAERTEAPCMVVPSGMATRTLAWCNAQAIWLLTVEVSLAFDLVADGVASLRATSHAPLASPELVPFKPRVDVFVSGCVRSERDLSGERHGIRVGALQRFVSVPKGSTTVSPIAWLSPCSIKERMLRHRTTPRERTWIERGMAAGDRAPAQLDFMVFNQAPTEQQLDQLLLPANIELRGLGRKRPLRSTLPNVRPAIRIASDRATALVPVRCDTVRVDAAAGVAVLTWRGVIAHPSDDSEMMLTLHTDALPRAPQANEAGRARKSPARRAPNSSRTMLGIGTAKHLARIAPPTDRALLQPLLVARAGITVAEIAALARAASSGDLSAAARRLQIPEDALGPLFRTWASELRRNPKLRRLLRTEEERWSPPLSTGKEANTNDTRGIY